MEEESEKVIGATRTTKQGSAVVVWKGENGNRDIIANPKETNGGVMAVHERGNDNERELAKMKWRKMGKGLK